MTRYLAYIWLVDFDAKHVPGSKIGAADALLRPGYWEEDKDLSDDTIDEYFEAKLYLIMVGPVYDSGTNVEVLRIHLNEAEYEGDDLILGKYLSIL